MDFKDFEEMARNAAQNIRAEIAGEAATPEEASWLVETVAEAFERELGNTDWAKEIAAARQRGASRQKRDPLV